MYNNVYNLIMRFASDINKAALNEIKHGVSFSEAEEVFSDPYAVEFFDEAHSDFEDRYKLVGMSGLRILLVVYTEQSDDVIRIITARKANSDEKRDYQKQKI